MFKTSRLPSLETFGLAHQNPQKNKLSHGVLWVDSESLKHYTHGKWLFGSKGHLTTEGDESGRVAQLVEQVTFNHWVTGSNPVALTIA